MNIKPCRKVKGNYDDRERFNRQMNYQSADRCFNMEFDTGLRTSSCGLSLRKQYNK